VQHLPGTSDIVVGKEFGFSLVAPHGVFMSSTNSPGGFADRRAFFS